jgi:hypothetical protein
MVSSDEFNKELNKIHEMNNFSNPFMEHEIEIIKKHYFNVIDKFNLGHSFIAMVLDLDQNSSLIVYCNNDFIHFYKFITKLDNMDNMDYCMDYNKYSYYKKDEYNKFLNDYQKYLRNDTLFLAVWESGSEIDGINRDKHLKDKNFEWGTESCFAHI